MNQNKSNKFSSPGFIVGVGRSGTTLLASILNRHPEVCVTPETHFFRLVYEYPGGLKKFKRNWPDSLREIMHKMHPTKAWQPDPESIISKFDSFPGIDILFKCIGEQIADIFNKPLWIEKTPNHINYLKEIRYFFPNAPIIHIVRDGRDVALSLLKVKWASQSYIENLLHWKRGILISKEFFYYDKLSLVIRYEDLVQDTELTIKKICAWLGIKFSPKLLIPDGTEDFLIEIGRSHKNNIKTPVNTSRMYRWKNKLDKKTKKIAILLLYNELKLFGYEIGDDYNVCNKCFAICIPNRWEKWPVLIDEVINTLISYEIVDGIKTFFDFYSLLRNRIFKKDIKIFLISSLLPRDIWAKNLIYKLKHMYKLFFQLLLLRFFDIKIVWLYDANIEATSLWPFKRRIEKYISKISHLIICPINKQELDKINALLELSTYKVIFLTDNKDGKNIVTNTIKRIFYNNNTE